MSLSRLLPYSTLFLSSMLLLSGCGGEADSPQSGAELLGATGETQLTFQTEPLPAASIGGGSVPDGPKPGSPEWIISKIKQLRREPLPAETGNDPQKLKAARAERNKEITKLATEAVALTHQQVDQEQSFTEAVHLLMESRLQLALQGDQESIDALYDDASSLYQRDATSKAAAEAAFVVARFAHTNARRFARDEPKWLEEFARQARIFATSFPAEEARAVSLLHAAGWSCELHGLTEEAVGCYALLKEHYPQTPQGKQVDSLLRRLTLAGKPLQLAGPTLDGGYVSVDEFHGQPLLVVFWASDADRFVERLPELQAVTNQFASVGLKVIGVNLDGEDSQVAAFVSEHKLPWPQIFYTDPAKRRWDSPIARYYGIRDIPMVWLVDAQGVVVDTQIEPGQLESRLSALINRPAER
jgi:peroxiredoxin